MNLVNLPYIFFLLKCKYSQTCIKRLPLGQTKSGLVRQVTSCIKRLPLGQTKSGLVRQVTSELKGYHWDKQKVVL
jgi:hypothetical protein